MWTEALAVGSQRSAMESKYEIYCRGRSFEEKKKSLFTPEGLCFRRPQRFGSRGLFSQHVIKSGVPREALDPPPIWWKLVGVGGANFETPRQHNRRDVPGPQFHLSAFGSRWPCFPSLDNGSAV